MYLINGIVIVMLLLFFAALSMESKPAKLSSGKTLADIVPWLSSFYKKIF